MSESGADTELFLKKLHERPHQPIGRWLRAPAHVHFKAFRMSDPPVQRPASRAEFQSLLAALKVAAESTVLKETFGYGIKESAGGDRLIVVWQAHTEYYNYQIWHLPANPEVSFGALTFPEYKVAIAPLGNEVCRLDILLMEEALPTRERMESLFPGPVLYGSRVFDESTSLVTSFTPDELGRERYWVSLRPKSQASRLKDIVDAIVRIETYYHLLLMQKPLFSAAIDHVYKFEKVHLEQREIITSHIGHANSETLQRWLNSLTQDLLKTNRIAGKLHFELSAAIPYDKIVHATLASIGEQRMEFYRPISDYVLSGITGVAEGYQQLLRRIDTLRGGFEGIIEIIRTRIDLIVEAQNLALLQSVDKTTKSQVLLQHTVEGLSVIVIAYYLAGLGGYVFKGLQEMGWLTNANIASAVFVPVAIGLAFAVTTFSKKYLHKQLSEERPTSKAEKLKE
ncbi:MAG: DUF3422 domain-containing protein [Nitrospira sp.]|nr:DUF3422 domain-containing protein [Nitrospira sp.]MDH4369159.1 DUF3422 domain-containing protein [Nitrospira sp.]MDH5346471.1 DUF3422 domain-containing protein [Nitrospira sp.]MDH5497506.1 DUF3422 domain-containing protein [Nitrospira sp.]MDH5724221.1 DUF3422 domain-containing protein [Nitrospira sp.]